MPAFVVGTVTVTDPARYSAYGAAIKGLAAQFGGEAVASGTVEEVMEGDTAVGERVVVVRFPTPEQARAYLTSPPYLAAKALRAGGAVVQLRLLVA